MDPIIETTFMNKVLICVVKSSAEQDHKNYSCNNKATVNATEKLKCKY